MSLRPIFASERYGSAPYRNCRGSSILGCVMVATDNEAALNAFGRHVGLGGRTAMLRKMWRAFETQVPPDDNGWADQGDVDLMQRAVWPDLPLPVKTMTADARKVWNSIGPNAISLAIDTGALPASDAIRRYVGAVTHQGVAWKKRTKNGRRQVKWMDPMHPRSNTYTGHWVDWSSLQKAAKAVPLSLAGAPGGKFIYEAYPAGRWTQARLAQDKAAATAKRLRTDLAAANVKVAALTAQLDSQSGNQGSKAAGWESALVRGIESLNALRTMGPGG